MGLVKKRKLKIKNWFIMLLFIGCISFGIYSYFQIPIKNIIVKNNEYLNDDYILDLANIRDYPKYYSVTTLGIKNKISKSNYISSVNVKRKFFHTIEINIKEKKALFFRAGDQKIVFNDRSSIEQDSNIVIFRVPRVVNDIPNSIYKDFIKHMDVINDDILSRISDIYYDPNDIDKERFLLYMDDGNMVYLTLTKLSKINYYNSVEEQLDGKKGVLYLDNGNHFIIKEQ